MVEQRLYKCFMFVKLTAITVCLGSRVSQVRVLSTLFASVVAQMVEHESENRIMFRDPCSNPSSTPLLMAMSLVRFQPTLAYEDVVQREHSSFC